MYQDPHETTDYTRTDWAKAKDGAESCWTFRRHKFVHDDDIIRDQAVNLTTKFDPDALTEARRQGKGYSPETETKIKANLSLCMMAHMGIEWSGPEFMLPKNAKRQDGTPHPRAGSIADCHDPEDIDLVIPGWQLEQLERYLQKLYLSRTGDEQHRFRDGPGTVAGSDGGDSPVSRPELSVVSS